MSVWTRNGPVTASLKDNACNIKILFNWSFRRYGIHKIYLLKHFQSFISEEKKLRIKGHSDLKCNNHFKHVTHLYFAIIFINYWTTIVIQVLHNLPVETDVLWPSRVWHLAFRLGARKGLLTNISGQKQNFWVLYILFWALSLKDLGAHSRITRIYICQVSLNVSVNPFLMYIVLNMAEKVTTIEILISKIISKAPARVYVCLWTITSTS